ncbi:MAG: PorT family protein [Flavobacteriales bacterium]|nr:PorT family protein [Flavobacteriales bacterium]
MKKNLITVTLLFCFGICATAQSELSIGPKLGVNTWKVEGNKLTQEGRYYRANYGAFINFEPWEFLSLQAEGLITKRDFDFKVENVLYQIETTFLDIPLMAKLRLPLGETLRPYLYGGYSYNFVVKQKGRINGVGDNDFIVEDNDFYKTSGNPILGFGVDFDTENFLIFLDGRYNIKNSEFSNSSAEVTISGTMISAGIGYKLAK